MAAPLRPRLFIGSSSGGQSLADVFLVGLDDVATVTSWRDGQPAPSAREFDAATFILCDRPAHSVLLRLGVFLGTLGRERIMVCPAVPDVQIPAELADLTLPAHPAAVREHLALLAAPSLHPAAGKSARRRRRSLGTAHSAKPEQSLRIADISLTGALLETFGEIPEHHILGLELALGCAERVRVTAEVVRIQHPQWGRVGGVGVRFVRFEGNSQEILARYLAAAEASEPTTA
jgi:hypothetical protein